MELSHAQEIEKVRRQIFVNEAEQRRLAIERPLKIHRAMTAMREEQRRTDAVNKKVYNKIIADHRSMVLPGDVAAGGNVETLDADDMLANELFAISGGNSGREAIPQTTDHKDTTTDDDALAEQLFQASGGA